MRGIVRWDGVPDPVREVAEAAVEPCLKYLPFWVHDLAVRVDPTPKEPDTVAEVTASLEYREALLVLYPGFFVASCADQVECVRHEVMHLLLAPLAEWTYKFLLKPLEEESPEAFEILEAQFWERVETVTQDLTFLMEER